MEKDKEKQADEINFKVFHDVPLKSPRRSKTQAKLFSNTIGQSGAPPSDQKMSHKKSVDNMRDAKMEILKTDSTPPAESEKIDFKIDFKLATPKN